MGTHPIFESDFDCLTEMVSPGAQPVINATGTPQPQNIDFDAEWSMIKNAFELNFQNKLGRKLYTETISRIYKICVAKPDPKSDELYNNSSAFLSDVTAQIAESLNYYEGDQLLEMYHKRWTDFVTSSHTLDGMCGYLNKHHTDQHQFNNVEIHMVDATDSPDQYLKMKELAYEKWKSNVLDKIDNKLVGACLNLIEKLRLGEEVTHTQQDQIKKAVGSFRDVRDHKKSKYRLDLYEEKFERKFLKETSDFYNEQAKKYLDNGEVGWYMTQVLQVIHDEEQRAMEMLWYTTKEKQKERIVKSLIYDGLDFLFEKADTMIRNEDASQLQKLYQPFEDMETPLAKLVKMFKTYVEEIGIDRILKAKTPKEFVDLVCAHYDKYKNFVNEVFKHHPGVEYRHQYDELDSANKKSFEPDKNFIESLKDAMRTVVNYKERGAQRAKAPDFLALFSDQLLKGKRGSEDVESKLDEVIKCLE